MWSPLHVASIKHSFFTLNQITIPYFALLSCFAGSDSGTVSGVVYDLFPAGIGPEREFRVIGFGTEIAYGPDRFPVRCLDRFDYRLLLHTTSE